jgi:hypothetical protein
MDKRYVMMEGVKKDMGECWKRGAKVDVTNQKTKTFYA